MEQNLSPEVSTIRLRGCERTMNSLLVALDLKQVSLDLEDLILDLQLNFST